VQGRVGQRAWVAALRPAQGKALPLSRKSLRYRHDLWHHVGSELDLNDAEVHTVYVHVQEDNRIRLPPRTHPGAHGKLVRRLGLAVKDRRLATCKATKHLAHVIADGGVVL